jgi:hypothetical protein
MDDLMEISVDADIGILYDDFMAMEEEYERSEPTGLVAADFPRHPPDDHLPRQVERQSSFEAPPQLAVAVVSDRDAATLDAVNLRESDAIFRDSFKQLAPLEVAAMIKSGEYNILFRTPKGEDKTMWHVQRATRAQFESMHKKLYTYRDLITGDIVFAIHHVATQAVLERRLGRDCFRVANSDLHMRLLQFQQVVEANSRYEYDVPDSAAAVCCCWIL